LEVDNENYQYIYFAFRSLQNDREVDFGAGSITTTEENQKGLEIFLNPESFLINPDITYTSSNCYINGLETSGQ